MRVGFKNPWRCAGAAMFLGSIAMFDTLQADDEPQPRGRPIEFSELNGGTSSTNTITLGSPSAGPLVMPDMVTKPDSIDMRGAPVQRMLPPVSGIATPRKRKNRTDEPMTPEDAFDRYLMEDVLGLPDFLTGDDDPRLGSARRNRGILSRNRGQTNSPAARGPVSSDAEDTDNSLPDTESERAPRRAISLEGTISPSKALFNSGSGGVGPPSRWLSGSSGAFAGDRRVETKPNEMRAPSTREDQVEVFRKSLNLQPAVSAERVSPPFAVGASPFSTPLAGSVNPAPQNLFSPPPGVGNPSLVPAAPTVPTAPSVPLAPGLQPPPTPDPSAQNKWMKPDPAPAFPRRQM